MPSVLSSYQSSLELVVLLLDAVKFLLESVGLSSAFRSLGCALLQLEVAFLHGRIQYSSVGINSSNNLK